MEAEQIQIRRKALNERLKASMYIEALESALADTKFKYSQQLETALMYASDLE